MEINIPEEVKRAQIRPVKYNGCYKPVPLRLVVVINCVLLHFANVFLVVWPLLDEILEMVLYSTVMPSMLGMTFCYIALLMSDPTDKAVLYSRKHSITPEGYSQYC